MKSILQILFAFLIVLTGWLALNHAFAQIKPTPVAPNTIIGFAGKLLVASDADQIGTAYANGVLNKVAGVEDSLTLVQFDANSNFIKKQIHVSNSVISWPSIITHSPDGRLVYVVETYGVHQREAQEVKSVYTDLPVGKQLTVLDISGLQPTIVQQLDIATHPKSASVNARGDLFVTSSSEKGKELVLAMLEDGLVKKPKSFAINGLERKGTNGGVNFVTFHPTQNVIAVIKDNRDVAFYKVQQDSDDLTITLIGEVRKVGKVLSVGNFTPDGKYFLVSDVGWGDSQLGNVFNNKGYLMSIRFNEAGNIALVSRAKVGLSPEGFDVSPDGKWAVAVNMRRTYLPKGLPFSLFAARKMNSLSLVKIDAETGALTTVGKEYGFEGELPEDAVFDLNSKNIAVAIYNQRFEAFPKEGFIEFWQLRGEQLVRTSTKVAVTRGPHSLKVLK